MEKGDFIPDARYYSEPVTVAGRDEWHKRALVLLKGLDIVFMDPPYGKGLETEVLDALADSSILHEDTLIIIETSIDTDISAYEKNGSFVIQRDKQYKTNRHVFLKPKTA